MNMLITLPVTRKLASTPFPLSRQLPSSPVIREAATTDESACSSTALQHITTGRLAVFENNRVDHYGNGSSLPVASLLIHAPHTRQAILAQGLRSLARTYASGHWSSPDLVPLLRLLLRHPSVILQPGGQLRFSDGFLLPGTQLGEKPLQQKLHLLEWLAIYDDPVATLGLWREQFLYHLPHMLARGLDLVTLRQQEFTLCYCEAGFIEYGSSARQRLFVVRD